MILLSSLKLGLAAALFIVCLNAQGPRYSQETVDAIQNQAISLLKGRADENRTNINSILQEQAALRSSMERFVGIGIGFGATLTLLQIAQLIQTRKNQR